MYSKAMTSNLTKLFGRDLEKLSAELEAYATETALWTLVGDIKNSPGTLTLHIVGSLNHFIGATLSHSDYVRDRDAEFSRQDVPREELLEMVEDKLSPPFDGGLKWVYRNFSSESKRETSGLRLTVDVCSALI